MRELLFFIGLLVTSACFGQSLDVIEIPISLREGYGPFPPPTRSIGLFRSWREETGKNIPAEWNDVKQGWIHMDHYQSLYQDYLQGKASEDDFMRQQQLYGRDVETDLRSGRLSSIPLKSKTAYAVCRDDKGKLIMIVDTDNDGDFSNDKPFKPLPDIVANKNGTSGALIPISYERLSEGKPTKVTVFVNILDKEGIDWQTIYFPYHWIADFEGQQIFVSSDLGMTFSFLHTLLLPEYAISKNGKAGDWDVVGREGYIILGGKLYINLGVNLNKGVLRLQPTDLTPDDVYSTQVGFRPELFEGTDILTGQEVSLEDYRGKYVLVDAGSVGYRPHYDDIPDIAKLYQRIDHSKIEFIGILNCDDGYMEKAKGFIEEFGISWPQLVNKSGKGYVVSRHPALLLIDPDGRIVFKSDKLHGTGLDVKLKEFLIE